MAINPTKSGNSVEDVGFEKRYLTTRTRINIIKKINVFD
jgi:hypothetical protein